MDDKKISELEKRIPTGIYRHFKGNRYRVIAIALDSEDLHAVVVYRALYGEGRVWVRDAGEFDGYIECDGKMIKRFEKCNNEDE